MDSSDRFSGISTTYQKDEVELKTFEEAGLNEFGRQQFLKLCIERKERIVQRFAQIKTELGNLELDLLAQRILLQHTDEQIEALSKFRVIEG